MNIEICKSILDHRAQLVPAIFTERQVDLVQRYSQHQKFTPSERAYFYSAIRRKMEALSSLREEYYVTGTEMLPERVKQAKQILKKLGYEKAFISGSFLFKKKYGDIDIFIISKRRKSFTKSKQHFTFIIPSDLHQPIFVSAAKYSVANFPAIVKTDLNKNRANDLLFTYQWVINQILEGEDQKELRDLLLQHSLRVEKKVPDARSLDLKTQELKALPREERINEVNMIVRETLLKMYSARYLYQIISKFQRNIQKMGNEYKTDNIPIFLSFAREVKNECRRAQAQD